MSVIEKHLFAGRLERVVFPYGRLKEATRIVNEAGGEFRLRFYGPPDVYHFDRKESTIEPKG